MSGGVDSAISAYILKKQGYYVEAVYMNNWDAREDSNTKCTVDQDLMSIEKTCKILGISKIHYLNYQSSYWQRVFEPVIEGYRTGIQTPNPDILCNREIKFGELYDWAVEGNGRADMLATGHYARIYGEYQLRQARDLSKDQTYFLNSIDRIKLKRTNFPVGAVMKSEVKTNLIWESRLEHLLKRKESMGLCFVGKSGKFSNFLSSFVSINRPGPIIDLESRKRFAVEHSGLSHYTIGQNIGISGSKTRLYAASKNVATNSLIVVDSLEHPALWKRTLRIKFSRSEFYFHNPIYCTIRSTDKRGIEVESVNNAGEGTLCVNLKRPIFAPSPGQWAVFYEDDGLTDDYGRLCLGGGEIL